MRVFFELVFSMTASRACRVIRVFSAFMRKATHISAEEDRVLLRPPKNGENGENQERFGPITGGYKGGKGASHSLQRKSWRVRNRISAAPVSGLKIAGNRSLTGPQKRTPYS